MNILKFWSNAREKTEFTSPKGVKTVEQPENLSATADTVREKVAAILVDAKFFTTVRWLTSKGNEIGYGAHPN